MLYPSAERDKRRYLRERLRWAQNRQRKQRSDAEEEKRKYFLTKKKALLGVFRREQFAKHTHAVLLGVALADFLKRLFAVQCLRKVRYRLTCKKTALKQAANALMLAAVMGPRLKRILRPLGPDYRTRLARQLRCALVVATTTVHASKED